MAQTAPPPPGAGIPRPLPRGGRPTRSRDTRPRFQPLDALWMALLAALSVMTGLTRHTNDIDLIASAGVIFVTYLLGWRSSGRSTGVIGALLLATSGLFASSVAHSIQTDLFALVTLGALFAFVAGSSLAALALAAAAVWLRADGIALGLMLMAFTLTQHRRRAWLGALIFFVPAVAALLVPHADGGLSLTSLTFGLHPTLLLCLAAPATLFTSWFLLPFFGEMADPVRRARWLPLVIWTALTLTLASVLAIRPGDAAAAPAPFLPLWFLLAGAGLARLLPSLTGDLPIPWLRYAVATLAILSLVAIRARVEWTPDRRPAVLSRAVVAPAPPALAVNPVLTPTPKPPKPAAPAPAKPAKLKPKPAQITKTKATPPVRPKAVAPKAVKPIVRQYVLKNGKLVHRSKWAIQWDLTHPHP